MFWQCWIPLIQFITFIESPNIFRFLHPFSAANIRRIFKLGNSAELLLSSPSPTISSKKWCFDKNSMAPPPQRLFCEAPSKKPHGIALSICTTRVSLCLVTLTCYGKAERIPQAKLAVIIGVHILLVKINLFLASQKSQITSKGRAVKISWDSVLLHCSHACRNELPVQMQSKPRAFWHSFLISLI